MPKPRLHEFPYIDVDQTQTAVVICHRRADADAYCSAYVLASSLRALSKTLKVSVVSPEGPAASISRIREKFPIEIVKEDELTNAQLVLVADTGDAALLGKMVEELQRSKALKVFIDHHPLNLSIKTLADKLVIDEEASSTCEIVYAILKAAKYSLTEKMAQALLTGILTDSQNLGSAKCTTIRNVYELCELGASIEASRKLIFIQRDFSERIARLKGAQRMQVHVGGKWVYASSEVGSFHASVSEGLIKLGADIAFSFGGKNGLMKGSLRATQAFYNETRIHLGVDIAKGLAKSSGTGGGHPTAAALTLRRVDCNLEDEALGLLSNKLEVEFKEVG